MIDYREPLPLFEASKPEPVGPIDRSVHHDDAVRLTGQNGDILARLRRGPATNVELATISLKYTSRLSDIRAAGYAIECVRGTGGVNTYRLEVSHGH